MACWPLSGAGDQENDPVYYREFIEMSEDKHPYAMFAGAFGGASMPVLMNGIRKLPLLHGALPRYIGLRTLN